MAHKIRHALDLIISLLLLGVVSSPGLGSLCRVLLLLPAAACPGLSPALGLGPGSQHRLEGKALMDVVMLLHGGYSAGLGLGTVSQQGEHRRGTLSCWGGLAGDIWLCAGSVGPSLLLSFSKGTAG